jgi:hypothetical protein
LARDARLSAGHPRFIVAEESAYFTSVLPLSSIWRNADANPETRLIYRVLNNPGALCFLDDLIELGQRSRRPAFWQRNGDVNGVESSRYRRCIRVTAFDQVDQPSVRSKHIRFAAAKHINGVCRKFRAQRQAHQVG